MGRKDSSIGRRQLFSLIWGDVKYLGFKILPGVNLERKLIRPPGALDEAAFLSSCQRCERCSEVCPEQAIQIAGAYQGPSIGTPYLEPWVKPCSFCVRCIEACPTGALKQAEPQASYVIGKAAIDREQCLTWQEQYCGACQNTCPVEPQAITFRDHRYPVIEEEMCTGCGRCASVCLAPVLAIGIEPLD